MTHNHLGDSQPQPPEFNNIKVTPEDVAEFASPESGLDDDTRARLAHLLGTLGSGELALPKLEVSGDEEDDFVTSLRDIADKIGLLKGSKIIYPGSSTHAGVARVFGKENVVHVDPDVRATTALKGAGYYTETTGISEYNPAVPVDAIVALNSYGELKEEDLQRLLRPGGYLVTNNYTGWASEAANLKGLELEGVLLPSYMTENPKYYEGDEIPADCTDTVKEYYKFSNEGGVALGTVEDYNFSEDSPRYPDGLFVFRHIE